MHIRFIRFFILLVFIIAERQFAIAQTYNGTGGAIPDNAAAGAVFTININNLPPALNSSWGLKSVCIDITHPRVKDLNIYLYDPSGYPVELSTGNGGNGANYINVCFEMSAMNMIGNDTAPYTGSYLPEHNLGVVNNGQNGNGNWRLVIKDLRAGNIGVLNFWNLTFGPNAPLPMDSMFTACNILQPDSCHCEDDTMLICALKPDIIIGEALLQGSAFYEEQKGRILVATASANIGLGPMEIIGTGQWYCGDSLVAGSGLCPDSTYSAQLVKQRIYTRTPFGYFIFSDSIVGKMRFHAAEGHQHLHIDDWSENSIRIKGSNPNPATWPVIAKGKKISFNIYDMAVCNNVFNACSYGGAVHVFSTMKNAGLGLGYESGNDIIQGLSVGKVDIYGRLYDGQDVSFDTTLCNGDYYLVAQFDPTNSFVERDKSNNISYRKITLTKQKTNCCTAYFNIDTINMGTRTFRFLDSSIAIPQQWYWDFGDGATDTVQFPLHTFQNSGTKNINLQTITAQGCTATYQFALFIPYTGIAEKSSAHFSIYPNPSADGKIQIVYDENTMASLNVTDIVGRSIIFDKKIEKGNNTITLPAQGIYFFTIIAGENSFTNKIIVR